MSLKILYPGKCSKGNISEAVGLLLIFVVVIVFDITSS